MKKTFQITGPLWRYSSENTSWFFVTVDPKTSSIIKSLQEPRPGFGSVRAELKCGSSTWKTSLFPSTTEKGYIIPIKASVRKAQKLTEGSPTSLHITLI